jgi:DNA-binding FadR family transcriptional regulator
LSDDVRGGSGTDRSDSERGWRELVVRLRSGAISEERFVAEMVSLREAFERIMGELTLEAKSSALAALASLKVPESQTRN